MSPFSPLACSSSSSSSSYRYRPRRGAEQQLNAEDHETALRCCCWSRFTLLMNHSIKCYQHCAPSNFPLHALLLDQKNNCNSLFWHISTANDDAALLNAPSNYRSLLPNRPQTLSITSAIPEQQTDSLSPASTILHSVERGEPIQDVGGRASIPQSAFSNRGRSGLLIINFAHTRASPGNKLLPL